MTTLLALDLETTGLDPHAGAILEVAWSVGVDIDDTRLDNIATALLDFTFPLEMSIDVLRMHSASGLLNDIAFGAQYGVAEAERAVVQSLQQIDALAGDVILLGNSPHFDHAWISVHMPVLASMLSHRHIDATSDWLLDMQAGVPSEKIVPHTPHRAAADIAASIEQVRRAVDRRRAARKGDR